MVVMEIIRTYSDRIVQLIIVSAIVITAMGGLKATGIYDKIKNKDVRKLLLFLSCIFLDLIAVVIYIVEEKVGWGNYLPAAIGAIGITTVMYAFYENAFVRNLIHLIFRNIKSGLLKVILKQQTVEEAKQDVIDVTSEVLKESVTDVAKALQVPEKQTDINVTEKPSKLVENNKASAENDFENLLFAVKEANGK